jgi:ubiquinone/menaquinone biosynthesis C-methylase UbiE
MINELNKIKEIYNNGDNIIQYLKSKSKTKKNALEDILISYDFQSGTYIEHYYKNIDFINDYSSAIADEINQLGKYDSIIEVGIGEGTTFATLMQYLKTTPKQKLGFDISLSRLLYAKKFLEEQKIQKVNLFTADLFNIPLLDNSVDIVYTSHSIEPNGGREKEALEELFRITRKYLILLEPAFEFASKEAKNRMKSHGYVKNLHLIAKDLGYDVIKHELFKNTANKLNPTGLIIIKKQSESKNHNEPVCPVIKSKLIKKSCSLFSEESLLAYPLINNIPCLLKENAIVATHLSKF